MQIDRHETAEGNHLGLQIRNSLAWSFANNIVGRIGSFVVGIAMARILVPEDFGMYAVGFVVLTVMLSVNELGVSLSIIRQRGPVARIAPTVNSLSIGFSTILFAGAWFAAPAFCDLMNAPDAVGIVRLLSATVLTDGITAVPGALITRDFMQSTRLVIDFISFGVSTPIAIVLAMTGAGGWSLAWSALAGNLIGAVLTVAWAPQRFLPGFDPGAAREVLDFGLPLAGASLVLLLMLNVDYVIVSRMLGTASLGLYVLAFNLCAWPVVLVSTAIRRVSMAAFARSCERGRGPESFRQAMFLALILTIPMCCLLASYADDLVTFLYGEKWSQAASAIPCLALLGVARVAVELAYDYLVAVGRTLSNLWVHTVWLVALVPSLYLGARINGIAGVALAHSMVIIIVVFPLVAIVLHRGGVQVGLVLKDSVPPVLGGILIAVSALAVKSTVDGSVLRLALGGSVGLALYGTLVTKRTMVAYRTLTAPDADDAPVV